MKRITLTVPPEVLQTAKLASQAFDPDVGGFYAFEAPDEETGLYSYTVNASDEYLQAFEVFRAQPEMLQQSIALDFEHRFPEATPPSLKDCEDFTQQLIIEVIE